MTAPPPAPARPVDPGPGPGPGSQPGRRRSGLLLLLRVVLPTLVVLGLFRVFGPGPFLDAVRVVDGTAVALALLTGALAVLAQADRWRTVAVGFEAPPRARDALRLTYQGTFLNMVLPGGVAGDAVRALRHPQGPGARVRTGVAVVATERLLGTAVVVLGASVAVLLGGAMLWTAGAGLLLTVVLLGLITPGLRRIGLRRSLRALLASVLLWAVLMGLFVHAAASVVPGIEVGRAAQLGAVCLAAMAIPLNVGGWGPRESLTAVAAMAWGLSGRDGVGAAAAYGVLALIGALPGGFLVLLDLVRRPSGGLGVLRPPRGRRSEHDLGAQVSTQHEPADGRA